MKLVKYIAAMLAGAILGIATNEALIDYLAVEIIALDTRPKAARSDAVKIARACMATKGAVATMYKNRSGNLRRVDCELRIDEKGQ